MKKLHESIKINAPIQRVWWAIIDKKLYEQWAETFMKGSTFEGGWNKGDKIKFIGPNEDGTISGMISEIAESNFPTFISIRHVGMIFNGVEDTTSDQIKAWTPAYENYTLKEENGVTEFVLDMDSNEEYYEMFKEMWPKALAKLKEIVEAIKPAKITTTTDVKAPLTKVWNTYTKPDQITKWAFASEDWEAPYAENDVRNGGRFKTHMQAKDKSFEFDFTGTYTNVKEHELIEYIMDDGRSANIQFKDNGDGTVKVTVIFEAEATNPEEMQRGGWQAILDNFKKQAEK